MIFFKKWAQWGSDFIFTHEKITSAFVGFVFLVITSLIWCNAYISSYSHYVVNPKDMSGLHVRVGIVFGSGISGNGKPYKELQGRLDGAAEALRNGTVDVLLLSGDNRFVNYNEPQAMEDYLVNTKHVKKEVLQKDFAGRSTYETCDRAHKVFGLDEAILFSAPSHLPRAIFTCGKLGVESYGVVAGADANNASRREFLARAKAIFNIYVLGEKTILGPKISL